MLKYSSSHQLEVYNEMNKTNLEYIGIFGLFGRYNIEIPFDKQVNIFVGENGLGKTTILNCIYFLLEKKFSRLANIPFSEIKIKFRKDSKTYRISPADIRAYEKNQRGDSYKYWSMPEISYANDIIENLIFRHSDEELKYDLEELTYELARRLDLPISVAKSTIIHYFEDRVDLRKNYEKGNKDNVVKVVEAISKNVTHRIIYLPTYRRIEDDFTSLNIRSEELNNAELLIKFGMSDVQNSIDEILKKIRSVAMQGFNEMASILLKQYADGKDPLKESIRRLNYDRLDYDTVKIVLDRIEKIEKHDKTRILDLVNSGKIIQYDYLYLWNLIDKLIDNYELQKKYDDRIKGFANTCNNYLNDKEFIYNQSTLNLDIFLKQGWGEDVRKVPLTQLSSGEKQIVSLFSKLYLESDKKSIVIIDEPELSLSLTWQKMLLPDIMRTTNCDLLLTVTHSPFIFENEFDLDAKEIRQCVKRYK